MNKYLTEYNNLLSKLKYQKNKFNLSYFSSPTLNKQETITFLYKKVLSSSENKITISVLEKFKFIPRLLYHFFFLSILSLLFRIKKLPKNHIFIRTWLVPRSINSKKIRDDYFQDLINDLSHKNKVIVGFQLLNYSKLFLDFKKNNKKKSFIIPIGLLSVFDIIKLLIKYTLNAKVQFKNQIHFDNKNINKIVNQSLLLDYYKCRSLQAYIDYEIAIKLKKYTPKKFIYIFENQAWENSYLYLFKKTKTETIG